MLAIITHHFMLHNATPLESINNNNFYYLAKILLLPIGKPAVLIFILITIWFSLEKQPDLKCAVKKIIKLNNIMIFYSLVIGAIFFGKVQTNELSQYLISAIFPLLTSLWWFPVTYSLIILFAPYFYSSLMRLSNNELVGLAAISILISGFLQYIPCFSIEAIKGNSLLEIVGLFPLICLIKKNYTNLNTRLSFRLLILINQFGFLIIGIEFLGCLYINNDFIKSLFENFYNSSIYDPASISSVLIAFSTFLFTLKLKIRTVHNLNQIAASSFSIYLLTDHPNMRKLLWTKLFTIQSLAKSTAPLIFQILVISISIAAAALIFDIVVRRTMWKIAKLTLLNRKGAANKSNQRY